MYNEKEAPPMMTTIRNVGNAEVYNRGYRLEENDGREEIFNPKGVKECEIFFFSNDMLVITCSEYHWGIVTDVYFDEEENELKVEVV